MDLISREAVENYVDNMPSELTEDGRRMIRAINVKEFIADCPSAFEGMTNEEVMKAVFGKSYADIDSYIYGSKDVEVKQWCRSPYKGVSE